MQARTLMGRRRRAAGAGLLLAAMMGCGGGFGPAALGAEPAHAQENEAFGFAFELFQGRHFSLAESNFSSFLSTFTNATHRADAVLYLARSRLEQSNFNGAIDLLEKSSAGAGGLRADYDFWIAMARLDAGELAGAAAGFATVARNFPLSDLRLRAAYEEADAQSRSGDWPAVIRLLQQANGPFQIAAAADAKSEYASMGWLLLAEALLHEQHPAEGEKIIGRLDGAALTQDLRWRRQYVLCRLQLAGGRGAEALAGATNLLALALDPRHQAASSYLQGEVLEQLGRLAEALGVYGKNLADSQPPEIQRQALARTIELTVALQPVGEAIQTLETNLALRPQAPGQDLARVSLGELYLKARAGTLGSAAESNAPVLLAGALTNLNVVISNFTNSPLLARARLDLGWCEWFATNIPAAKADFEEAAAHLPFSAEQAVARFKLADAQFMLKDYAGAAGNYRLVLTAYDTAPEVTNSLCDLALYQIAEADILRGDDPGAGAAVEEILRRYPESYYGDRGSLLMGEDWNRKYDYAKARTVFSALLQRSPHSPLLSKVQYAIARTYDYAGSWSEAIGRYKEWEASHGGDPLLPEVEFHLALASIKAGLTNNALAIFTNFAARFPSHPLAPWALNEVADYYYDQGQLDNQGELVSAEKYYEELSAYPGAGDLAFEALFWAGKSALARQGMDEAHNYFVKLVSLTNAPPALVQRGYFALGDVLFAQYQTTPTNGNYLDQAISAISQATNGAPTNAVAVEALGRLAEYDMEWAKKNKSANAYEIVKQIYETIAHFPDAGVDVAARSQAEVGLGLVAEQQGRLDEALAHYVKVFYPSPGHFDPYWVNRAGEYAARVCEARQRWSEAVTVYERLLKAAPALRPVLEKKRAEALARRDAQGN